MTEELSASPHYVPLLKGRPGELRALSQAWASERAGMTPLLEVVPTTLQVDDEGEVDPASLDAALTRFVDQLTRSWKVGARIILDGGALPPVASRSGTAALLERFAGTAFHTVPVVRPSDSDAERREIGAATARLSSPGACIRLGGEDLDDADVPLSASIDELLRTLALDPRSMDVVIDLGSVTDERTAAFANRIARLVLADLPYLDDWRTVVLASGSFPPDLGGVPPQVPTEVPRMEPALWNSVRSRWGGRLDFGDYAIANPVQGGGAPFAPAPQLRYTGPDQWIVMKGRRNDPRGPRQFYEICDRVAAHPAFTPGLSWGDDYVTSAALSMNGDDFVGPGNAMLWRAIGTSHHLAYVVSGLTSSGAP